MIYRQFVKKNCHFSINFIFFSNVFICFFNFLIRFKTISKFYSICIIVRRIFFKIVYFFFRKFERINIRFSLCFHLSNAFNFSFFNENRKRNALIMNFCEFTHDFFYFSSMTFRKLFKSSTMTIQKRTK